MYLAMKRLVVDHGLRAYNATLTAHGLSPVATFEELFRGHDVLFVNGVPGFEYPTRRPQPSIRYAGMLRPYRSASAARPPELAADGRRVVLISQGTVDNDDPGKLIVPALEGLIPTRALLIVGTGHKHTEALRRRFPQANVSIHDYVDFESVLDCTDIFVCNGGRGSVLLSLSKGVPLVGAGVREGKNDVNAHVEHFGVGVNLRTEKPTAGQIARAVDRVLSTPSYKRRAQALQDEISRYQPLAVIDEYLATEVAPGGPQPSAGGSEAGSTLTASAYQD
jgi:UDP:flavonoid glycosyltransferase YjiC (YdhE family)